MSMCLCHTLHAYHAKGCVSFKQLWLDIQAHQGILLIKGSKVLSQMFTSTPINTGGGKDTGLKKDSELDC